MAEVTLELHSQILDRIDQIVSEASIYEDRHDFLIHVILHHIEMHG